MSKMDLIILFGQRPESYPGEHAPEALAVMDEYSLDANPDGWKSIRDIAMLPAAEFVSVCEVRISVDQDKIRSLLIDAPRVDGEIVEDES